MNPRKVCACLLAAILVAPLPPCLAGGGKTRTRGRNPGAQNGAAMATTAATDVVPPPGMVYVPAGTVKRGNTVEELETVRKRFHLELQGADAAVRNELISGAAQVEKVHGFFIDRFEVTNRAYGRFVRSTSHPAPPSWTVEEGKPATYPKSMAMLPVVEVTYVDAAAYAMWAGKRIPTELEWERAARGDDGRLFPWGNYWDDREEAFLGKGIRGKDLKGYKRDNHCNSAEVGVGRPMKVGSFPSGASPFGVLDMAGNVWEWTSTMIAPYPRGNEELSSVYGRVLKGGSCLNIQKAQRPAVRVHFDPGSSNTAIGFRCVKSERPGVDRLAYAYEILMPSFPAGSPAIDVFKNAQALENARYDPESGDPLGAESIGFSGISSIPVTDAKGLTRLAQKTDKLTSQYLLAVLHTDRTIENLGLDPGDYAVFFQAKDSKAYERYERERAKKAAGEAGDDKGAKGAGSASPPPPAPAGKEDAPAEEGLAPFSRVHRIIFKDRRGVVRAEIPDPKVVVQTGGASSLEGSGTEMTMKLVIRPSFGSKVLGIDIPLRISKPL